MEYAEGLAMLANPFTAALAPGHFAAAAAYGTAAAAAGAIGVGTGLAARAFGGGAGGSSKSATGAFVQTTQGRTSSGNGGSLYSGTDSGNSSNNNRTIDEARFRQTNVTHTVNIAVQSNDSHIANVVQENINNRGGIHGLILKVVDP
jgi:L-aminopeptidase/D-esterase-like protein